MRTWQLKTLRDAGVKLIDCDHRTPPPAEVGFPYVSIPELRDGRIEVEAARKISPDHFAEWTRKANPQAHDVVLSRRCNPGETAFVRPGMRFALGQNLVLLRSVGDEIRPEFLRWLVRGPGWWEQVEQFRNVGAVFDSLKCADVPKFKLAIPTRDEQVQIARILDSVDDKIDLNRRMGQTLEAMAQAIFKARFVDASAESAPITTLKALTSKIGSGATPRGGREVYVDEGVALVRSQNVYDAGFVWDGLARITDDAARQLANVELQAGDVLLNITGASILRTCVVPTEVLPARVNQHVAIVRAKPGVSPHYLHLHLLQPETKAYLLGLNAGGSREAVTKAHIESVPVPDPGTERMRAFHEAVAPLLALAHARHAEARALASVRDALLPRLLSGELVQPSQGNGEAEMIQDAATA